MKRLLSLAVLGTAALLLPSSVVYAQRGAAHGGGGSGFHSSGGGGFHSSGSMGGGFRSAGASGFRSSGFQSSGFRSGGVRSSGFRSQGFRSSGVRSSGFRSSGATVRANGFRSFGARGGTVRVASGRSFSRSFGVGRVGIGRNAFFRGGFGRFGFRSSFFFDRCFGCFSPFFFTGGFFWGSPFYPYYPYYPGDYYGYPYNYGYGPTDYSQQSYNNNDNTAQLSADVQRLSDEVADMRDSDGYTHFSDRGPAPPGTSLSAKDPSVNTVFVFRDGRQISGQNYAIAGPTLWIFNEHSARKFPISDLDAAGTEKANAANGVEIHIPDGAEKH